MIEEKLYSTQDVATRLGVTTGRIRQICAEGDVGVKYGRDWFFRESDIAKLQSRPTKQKKDKKIA